MVMASVKGMVDTTEQLPIDAIGPHDVYLSYLPLAHVLGKGSLISLKNPLLPLSRTSIHPLKVLLPFILLKCHKILQ